MEIAVPVRLPADRRGTIGHRCFEVVAAGAVDLERHVVGFSLGVGRRPLLVGGGKGVGPNLFQHA